MARWGMVIDLTKCIGCKACSVNCRQSHGAAAHSWRRIEDCGLGESDLWQRLFLPVCCNHCSEPPCLDVCPTGATYQRGDGIVGIRAERCLGCGYCILACPYRARSLFRAGSQPVSEATQAEPGADETERTRRGVCGKCDFCLERLDQASRQGVQPGQSEEATPQCVLSCSAEALHFGNLEDPKSKVVRLIREHGAVRLQEEMGSDPALYLILPPGWKGDRLRKED